LDGLTIAAPITLGAAGTNATLNAPTSGTSGGQVQTVTLNGAIGGDGDLTLNGSAGNNSYGTIVLGAANDYSGATLINCTSQGATCFVVSGTTDALPPGTVLTLDGGPGTGSGRTLRYDLNGSDQTLAGLTYVRRIARNQRVTNTGAAATLTINNSDDYAFGDVYNYTYIGDPKTTLTRIEGAISLVKTAGGTFTLAKGHTYTGTTAVNEGTLGLDGASLTSAVTVDGGASIQFTLGAPASTTGSLDLGTGTVKIDGTVDGSSNYQLMTATGGITGTLTLDSAITDYALELQNSDTELWLVYTGTTTYASWSGGAAADGDANGDGVQNAVAYALGAVDVNENAIALLPTFDNSGVDNFVYTFNRSDEAEADPTTTITVEYGTTLSSWKTAPDLGDGVTVDDSGASVGGLTPVIVTIPKSLAVDGKLFARLKVVVTP